MSHLNIGNQAGEISLAIAHLNVRINCYHAELANVLRERYCDFLSQQQDNCFKVEIHWIGKEHILSLSEINPYFQEEILNISTPGVDGFINVKQGQGALTFQSERPVEEIDYFLRMIFALLACNAGGILLHTAGIIRDGQGYLFFGHSGSGKTTVCRVSQSDHSILNDDLILLLPGKKGWQAFGTPFWNPTQVKPNGGNAPVAGLYLLVQAHQVFTVPMAGGRAIAALIANVPVIPQDPHRSTRLLEILSNIQSVIPISELHFKPDNSFWNVISPRIS